jgi:N-methylhydantoinase A
VEGLPIEVVSWAVKAASELPPVEPVKEIAAAEAASPRGERRMFDADAGRFVDAAVHARSDLVPGASVTGPAIIVERETATVVTSTFEAVVQRDGCILVARI